MNKISVPFMLGTAVLAVIIALLGFWAGHDTVDGWAVASRWTARWAAFVFLLVFATSTALRLAPGPVTQWAMRHRRGTGLSFALAHVIHAIVFTLAIRNGVFVPLSTVLGGAVIYLVMFLLVLTSTNGAMRRMGAWWKGLHSFGVWLLWLNFTIAFTSGLSATDPSRQIASTIAIAAFLGAGGIKLASRFIRRPVRAPA